MNIVFKKDTIECFQKTCEKILIEIFDINPANVLVTDHTTILDFSITQEDLDIHINHIKERYDIDLRKSKDYKIISLCREVEERSEIKKH